MVGVLGANRNPEIWGDDAYEWKPNRWLSALPDTITRAHYPGIYSNMSVGILMFCKYNSLTLPIG